MNAAKKAQATAAWLDLIVEIEAGDWPAAQELEVLARRATEACLAEVEFSAPPHSELGLTFTDDAHIAALNGEWRGKDRATNVLSFPLAELRPGDALPALLGDIVFGFETVSREAQEQGKPFIDHLTHLVVHGLLHLLGHDHIEDEEAETMEALERRILQHLAIPDPYA